MNTTSGSDCRAPFEASPDLHVAPYGLVPVATAAAESRLGSVGGQRIASYFGSETSQPQCQPRSLNRCACDEDPPCLPELRYHSTPSGRLRFPTDIGDGSCRAALSIACKSRNVCTLSTARSPPTGRVDRAPQRGLRTSSMTAPSRAKRPLSQKTTARSGYQPSVGSQYFSGPRSGRVGRVSQMSRHRRRAADPAGRGDTRPHAAI
jgi:hypothetical protein